MNHRADAIHRSVERPRPPNVAPEHPDALAGEVDGVFVWQSQHPHGVAAGLQLRYQMPADEPVAARDEDVAHPSTSSGSSILTPRRYHSTARLTPSRRLTRGTKESSCLARLIMKRF